ncbi:hypothetical protein PFDSM3638_07135 [Pyrococcus furiosus DSM 3638]|uniref:MrpA C-terminal/MbhD domain-containing protein n=2 Tax=Pyrococcus furiosus TaxID=2261 RepID=A0A5C0XR78_PYRFU|nr:hypothetical protein PFC_06355 [Pyrococcus furiosus COM1]QEK79055.1 hypothetical protein PFDSM3638_07135 [Pyrococcus furiosus DSM 3638]
MRKMNLDMIIQFIVLGGIILSSVLMIVTRDLLVAVLASAAMSLLLSLEFYMLHAPDVAIAEAAVGAGVVTALVMYAISKTERWEREAP